MNMISKLSIMAFPQKQEGKNLYLNVFIVVRNFNPLIDDAINALSPSWVKSNLRLQVKVINSTEDYPRLDLASTAYDLPAIKMPAEAEAVFTSLKSKFKITKTDRATITKVHDVKKYLPLTYRQSFNFTSAKNNNVCVTGDEYHCAVKKNDQPNPAFAPAGIPDDTSWGKVFAFCLRHKELAKKCGFIYDELIITLDDDTYKNGGWLYIDHHPDCSYYNATQTDQTYTKRYAARIPKLDLTDAKGRNLFAAVQFPVLIDNGAPQPDYPVAPSTSILDEMYIEAAEYDDGFCKITHNYQPVTNNLIKEEQDDESPVTNDIGIRLGWDDEQLAIWHARQLGADPATGQRADVPLGVYQYRIDVRKKSDDPLTPNKWIPLCRVRYNKDLMLDATRIGNKDDELEMGVEVYPAQLDAADVANGTFWLPSYFTQWIGSSLVLQDEDAIAIYHKDEIARNSFSKGDYDQPTEKTFKATKHDFYKAVGLDQIQLLYGHDYEFRVRLADITGGGPLLSDEPIYDSVAPVTNCHFVRHVIPQTFNFITPLPAKDTELFSGNALSVKRPLLGYPSILFTGVYTDAVDKLIADSNVVINNNLKRDIGLYDPDVDKMEIIVEVKCLGMDTTIRKRNLKENYALLYITHRFFTGENFDAQLDVPFTFIDAPVLSFTGSQQLPDLGLHTSGKTNIDERTDLVLPTARDIRITVRPVTKTKADYYGGVNAEGANRTELKGMASSFITRKAATSEKNLFKPTGDLMMIRGLYLQPDEAIQITTDVNNLLVANLSTNDRIPPMIQRVSNAIGCDSKGMSLIGNTGQRWQFGVSRFIRHSASPDNTNITFSTKDDLLNHWIVPLTLLLDRDWTWDGVQVVSINVYRRKIFMLDAMKQFAITDRDEFLSSFSAADVMSNASVRLVAKEELVGDIELKHAINIQALTQSDRTQTFCCFIDAVEPKQDDPVKFPDEIFVSYRVAVNYLKDGANVPSHDDDVQLALHLPITIIPAQMPKIVSAGMAFSKYVRDKNYANTEARKKYLWVEFDKPVQDPNDAYYARMLAYAPDTLLAKWDAELLIAPQEPSLPIEPEPIRIISTASSDDKSGLHAMQEMVKANDSDVHYLVPLPPGLHVDSLEMFGFFTYEFRVGHKIPWTTAQGRFGRALRNTGIQHPVPQLYCLTERNQAGIHVTAPYAQTVFNGRNVTSNPPRTEIWALLYAQVKMADDSDLRNVLLDDKKLRIPFVYNPAEVYLNIAGSSNAAPQGVASWHDNEVENLLSLYGLPADSSLSVLCVEMMPGYENFLINQQYYANNERLLRGGNVYDKTLNVNAFKQFIAAAGNAMDAMRIQIRNAQQPASEYENIRWVEDDEGPRPLTSDLGNYRILRTSLLVAVPEICCTTC